MTSHQSKAKQAYDKAYNARPEQIKNRAARNKARAEVEKKLGHKLGSHVDVDHKKPIDNGGTNAPGNLRTVSESRNSSWRKGSKGYKVKSV